MLFAGAAFVVARLEHFAGADISGVVRVVDGDSLALDKRRLRLKGIDAPELKQRCRKDGYDYGCGVEAASYLRGLVGSRAVECKGEGVDRYGRDLVRCKAGGVDLNQTMVRSGHAVAFGDYRLAEVEARAERAGLWAGEFDQPKQWRAVHGGLDEGLHSGLSALMAVLRRLSGF
ncbi:MAG: thermonuclease family protein [Hoeflea sp.]|uniref:thermonuclease family protein n=1 Tax=Hoeflea sp. TaxID=1940281 RepID=UPI003EF76AB0